MSSYSRSSLARSLSALSVAVILGQGNVAAAQSSPKRFDIERQTLSSALNEFARQSDRQILFSTEVVDAKRTNGIKGELEPEAALRQLLEGTGLTFRVTTGNTILVETLHAGETANVPVPNGSFRLAQLGASQDPASTANEEQTDQSPSGVSDQRAELDEIIVTGTHIRGIQSPAAPLTVFDRTDIERTGLSTTEDFIKTLPQNFGGGNSSSVVGGILGGEGAGLNYGFATGINLRGLGNLSTLTLINGRRIAPAGVGNVIDVSLIPLNAIERMEVMTDGASAIYGSDAVGGVVNIITRRDFDGVEAHGRYGSVTSGSHSKSEAGAVWGGNWTDGSALVSYDYGKKTNLDSRDRAFTVGAMDPTDLLPEESRHTVLASLMQSAGDNVELALDGFFGKRYTALLLTNPLLYDSDSSAKQYGLMADGKVDIGAGWRADIAAGFSQNKTESTTVLGGGLQTSVFNGRARIWSIDVAADGPVAEIPGGEIKLAGGGHYRHESYNSTGTAGPSGGTNKRDVSAVFGELFIPIVGQKNAMPLVERLELTVAGRYEHYTAAGSATDPKIGLLWSPAQPLAVRGTYGTSFRAPLLSEQGGRLLYAVFPLPNPAAPGGATPTLLLQGGNPGLEPESAATWTVGADFKPATIPGFTATATYFKADFEDRITNAFTANQIFSVFLNPANFPAYGQYFLLNPPLALVNSYYADPNFQNPINIPAVAVGAILDNRLANVAQRIEDGIDFTIAYVTDTTVGQIDTQLSATHLFGMKDRFTPVAPQVSVLNRPYYPNDWKLRGSLGWSNEWLSATVFVNHVGSYEDLRTTPPFEISSWTTVDLAAAYTLPGQLDKVDVALSVLNLFDKDPPLVPHAIALNYDPTNAEALGRFIAVQLRARL